LYHFETSKIWSTRCLRFDEEWSRVLIIIRIKMIWVLIFTRLKMIWVLILLVSKMIRVLILLVSKWYESNFYSYQNDIRSLETKGLGVTSDVPRLRTNWRFDLQGFAIWWRMVKGSNYNSHQNDTSSNFYCLKMIWFLIWEANWMT
jgi:hypothetical protein